MEVIGAGLASIRRAEDRELFRDAVRSVGLRVPESRIVTSLDELGDVALPAVVRPAFTLGGHGGGFASTRAELRLRVEAGLRESPIGQVLVEESVRGWDEFELEVMRDAVDNVVVVCSIENLDPMGTHTGDSVTVAPQMTLSDEAYQELRDAAAAVIRAVGVECGGSNIQFARDRESGEIRVIEMNPRVSRSSALASKATGYPIAKVAAKLAVGYTLDEIPNDLTRTTPASFEPTLDYVVVKFPRFAFEKFPGADRTLGTQMKSVGETMGIGRTFAEAFVKAMESRELDRGAVTPWSDLDDLPEGLHPWFRTELESLRLRQGERVYRRVDSVAGEVEAASNYYYSTIGEHDEALPPKSTPRVVVLGSGPNRIGQGIEFDYCCVHAAQAFRSLGYEAVMVNCNPETVSTDYDTSDRLYFEPLTEEYVLAVCEREQPDGVVIQFGGQTPLKLAHALERAGFPILGTPHEAIDLAEDRQRFATVLADHGIRCPEWGIAASADDAIAIAERIGYPVLVRPSYVLGGRAMRVCYRPEQVHEAFAAGPRGPTLVDRFLEGALEIDVDALCDGRDTYVAAVMEHVEEAGVHSGDSSCALPAPSLDAEQDAAVEELVSRLAAGARSDRSRQRPAGSGGWRDLGAGGEPSRVTHRAVREQGDRRQSRRGGLPADGRRVAGVARAASAPARRRRVREGGRAAVRTFPRLRPRAGPGDALHGRGDGHRRRLPQRFRQGGAGRRAAVAAVGHGVRLRTRRRQAGDRPRGRNAGGARLPARGDGGDGRRPHRSGRRCGDGGQGLRGCRRRRHGRRPHPPRALRPRDQHAARVRRGALGRLSHP